MDRGMASGEVEKFILIAANGVASKSWGPNGSGNDLNAFNSFEGELRNDLIPYMKANFNIKDGRDNIAMSGLSMGGIQTFDIGIAKCLDIISHFGGYSGAHLSNPAEFIAAIDANKDFDGLMIHNLYMTCGDEDHLAKDTFPLTIEGFRYWNRVENFKDYMFPHGTHDFPVWYNGFNDFIHMVFKYKKNSEEPSQPGEVEEPVDLEGQSDVEEPTFNEDSASDVDAE